MDLSYLHNIDPAKGELGHAVLMLLTAIYQNVVQFGDRNQYPEDHSQELLKDPDPKYDFIIVGSSAAGCILANRLSEIPGANILLIEAGTYPSATSEVPFLFFTLGGGKEDWGFVISDEKEACKGFENGNCFISKGKILGGTHAISNMHYYRGDPFDYDRWNMDEWKSSKVMKTFSTFEKYSGKTSTSFDVGTKGNMTLNYFKSDHFLRLPLSKMYKTAGYKQLIKGKYVGYNQVLVSTQNSVKMNMAKLFLTPIKERKNVHIALNTMATGILFTEEKKVSALELMIGKNKKVVKINNELILTGGAINNVKLLQTSGIGPRDILEKLNIPVVSELPVGKGLRIHFRVPIFVAIDKCCGQCLNCSTPDCQNDFFDDQEFHQSTWDYIMDRIGFFTNTGINDFIAYVSTNQKSKNIPNICVNHMYFKRNDFYLKSFLESKRFHPTVIRSILKYNKVRNIMVFFPTILESESIGEVYINTTDYKVQPTIKANFLTDEKKADYGNIYAAVTMIVSLIDSLAMQRYKAKFLNIDIPSCRNFKFCSEYYFTCMIKNLGYGTKTLTSVAKMGSKNSNTTVVDETQKVLNVEGLRLADSSIAPAASISLGIPNDALFAEKLADTLKSKWSKKLKPTHQTKS